MSLLELRQNISDSLSGSIDVLRGAYTYGGDFDAREIIRVAVQSPCIVTACLGVGSATIQGSTTVANAQWGVFVVCRGTSQEPRDVQSLALVEVILSKVYANDWKARAVGGAKNVKAQNLFSDDIDKKGTAMWAVLWDQSVDLVSDVSELTPFMGVNATWNLTESTNHPDATDTIQLQGDQS